MIQQFAKGEKLKPEHLKEALKCVKVAEKENWSLYYSKGFSPNGYFLVPKGEGSTKYAGGSMVDACKAFNEAV